MEFRKHVLENGLEIIAECNPQAYTMGVGFFVKTGSRDETDGVAGVSHFLEHMVFKGTPTRTAEDVNRELDEMGSEANAFTSRERTVYHAVVLPEFQDRAVELLCDMMRPSLRDEDFETEKQVILEEIAMYEDQPPFNAPDKCIAAFCGDHPLARCVLGTTESITALTAAQMKEYFQRRYSPQNICLVAAGNVDFDRLVQFADRHCGSWEPVAQGRDLPPLQGICGNRLIQKESSTQQYVVQMAAGPSATDDDRFAARLLSVILGDDSGSRFYWELIDTGLAEYADMGCQHFDGAGAMMTYLYCAPEDAESNLRCMRDVVDEAEASGVTQDELDRAKSKIRSRIVISSERPANRLFAVGSAWLQRREYVTVREAMQRYDRVTLDDLANVLAKYPLSKNMTFAIGPLGRLTVA